MKRLDLIFTGLRKMALPMLCFLPMALFSQKGGQKVIIHLRGVYDADIQVMNIQKKKYSFLPILEQTGVLGGSTASLTVPEEDLPGQFTIQVKYRIKPVDYPYPVTKSIYIGKQDVEMWINPLYSTSPDSTWFAKGEMENTSWEKFQAENGVRKEKIQLLQLFLMKYDDTKSELYTQAGKEYKKRRDDYNHWVESNASRNKDLFVSRLYQFQQIPAFSFAGSDKDRTASLLEHYFDCINLNDDLLAGTMTFNEWLTTYVNLNNEGYTTKAEVDTMLVKAARRLLEWVKKTASPKVYGFVVDYFYNGFESYDMFEGVKMLDAFANDPRCLTTKRLEIARRLAGLETLKIGSLVPEISMKDSTGNMFSLRNYKNTTPRKLVIFWSADCSHCAKTMQDLKTWYDNGHQQAVDVIAISIDETVTEVAKWKEAVKKFPGWVHLRAEGGINSKVAYDYAVLATPFLYLLSASKNTIIGIPDDVKELNAMIVDPY